VVPAPIDSSASAVASDLELLKSLVAKLRDAGLGETVSRLVDSTLEQPPASGFSLFLAEKTKKVHFIRHAEGFHNAATTAAGGSHDCLLRGELAAASVHPLWDARLTEKGVQQARDLRSHLALSNQRFDLVVVSPLTRTLETAQHIFGTSSPPTSGESDATSSQRLDPGTRCLVVELCRERWGQVRRATPQQNETPPPPLAPLLPPAPFPAQPS
jgi:hypothetical protein